MPRFLTLIFIANLSALAQTGKTENDSLAREGIYLAYNLQLDQAERIFERIISQKPDDPQGYVLHAVVLYYRYILDKTTPQIAKRFEHYAGEAIRKADRKLAKNKQDIDALFNTGTAYIYWAALNGENGSWMKAFWNGTRGISYLERAVAIDSNYYDAYFGLGMYHYYADALPNVVKSVTGLFGLDADRQQGLRELRMAMNKGAFAKAGAAYFLGKIYTELEKDDEKAYECFRFLTEHYPNNAGFLLDFGESQRRMGLYSKAMQTFESVLEKAGTNGTKQFPIFEKLAYYNLGHVYYNLKSFGKAKEMFLQAIARQVPLAKANAWINAQGNKKIAQIGELVNQER